MDKERNSHIYCLHYLERLSFKKSNTLWYLNKTWWWYRHKCATEDKVLIKKSYSDLCKLLILIWTVHQCINWNLQININQESYAVCLHTQNEINAAMIRRTHLNKESLILFWKFIKFISLMHYNYYHLTVSCYMC